MSQVFKIKNSTEAGKAPAAGDLKTAELALNLADQKLYSKDASGTVFEIGTDGDTRYLSKVNDDTAAGAITFEDQTTHEAGISVTGEPDTTDGTVIYKDLSDNTAFFSNTTANGASRIQLAGTGIVGIVSRTDDTTGVFAGGELTNTSDDLYLFRQQASLPTTAKAVNGITSWIIGAGSNLTGTVRLFNAELGPNNIPTASTVYGYFANAQIGQEATSSGIGFYSNISQNAGKDNFNFYSANTAPSFFAGKFIVADDPAKASPGFGNTDTGFSAAAGGRVCASHVSGTALSVNVNATATIVSFRYQGNEVGNIKTDGSNISIHGQSSDYRIKEDVTPLTGASDIVKAIDVVNFKYTDRGNGEIRRGFIAHQLQEAGVPEAVWGSKDETEAIGTLRDWNGTELETEVTEPSAEELTYTEDVTDEAGVVTQTVRTKTWTATGERPVYQSVDASKLVPLLVKSLQEALERIEALEAKATVRKKR